MKKHIISDVKGHKRDKYICKRVACVFLSAVLSLGLGGCGKEKAQDIPELIEPVSTNEAYRPVTYGDIGRVVIKKGTIVPTDTCYFFEKAVDLDKIYVGIGDKVKKGDVLAEADTSSGGDAEGDDTGEGSDEESGVDAKKYSHNIKEKIFEQNQIELDWKIKACEEIGDEKGASDARVQKAVNAENNRYENELYNREMKKISDAEKEDKDKKNGGTLKAEKDGYVTYVKHFDGGEKNVGAGENVVVVSDYAQPYIELPGESYKKDTYSMYKNMYTVVNGKKYDIVEYTYSNQEIAMAQSMQSMPYSRFQLKDAKNIKDILTVGNSVSLYFSTSDAKNVLTVGKDSIYDENGQTFVYVKTETSQKERRNVETGASDANYVEVVSGLSEGELVYYASDAVMPSEYMEYKVALDSYTKTTGTEDFSVKDLESTSYTSPCDGRFVSLDVKKGDKVKKGDLLFVIDSGGGTAAVKDIELQIQDENQNYSDNLQEFDDQIIEFNKQIEHYQKTKATPTDAENTLYMAEQLMCQRNVAQFNKELVTYMHNIRINKLTAQKEKLNKNNDGTGKISVYAEQDGKVLSVEANTDVAVSEGQAVCSIGGNENNILALKISEGTLGINQTVTIVNKSNDKEKINGTIVGTSGDSARSYIQTDSDGNIHVTKCNGDGELLYYIKPDDDVVFSKAKYYKISYPTVSYENVVMIPNNMLYQEASKKNSAVYDYVWLIKGDEIVKQYVTLGEATKNDTIILTGLKEGDVIAKETGASKLQGPNAPGKNENNEEKAEE